ncbi:TolC family outer membrane protein [Rubellimicrobium sp. CFH 75288]|uniref:TolC family outer membrane protein n=1 Tax=Rubellimicrobium sp. CFH 75288 TaxID=2697034 RepID=UPI0014120FCB|nr:TolC family outer membrane protein [Rubellimicrobium sp. CFH 75288]NAZ35747.1 TolC family outer membrane protein [Rubellimicrobium sp. CFH 75288]
MGRTIRRAIAAAMIWAAAAGAAAAETLADALAAAYRNSGLIEQNRALLRAADEDVAQAVAALRPILNWTTNLQATWPDPSPFGSTYRLGDVALTANAGLQASYTLWDAGSRELGVEAQKEIVLATRAALVNAEQQVLFRVVQAYMEVRRISAFVDLRQNNLRLITRELRAAQDRFEVGEVTRTDVALAQARLAAAQSQLAAEQGALTRAVEEFRAAVGRAPGTLAPAPPARLPGSPAAASDIALRTHPAILQAQHEVAAAEIAILRARAAMRPTVTLSGQVQIDQDFNEGAALALQAQGPLYQGGRLASQVRQFMARRDAARAQLLQTTRQVAQNVANAYSILEVARAGRQAFEAQVRAAQAAFDGVREEATLGARTTLDVLDAEQELLDARANLISAEVDETVAGYQILSAAGLLTAQNLGLAVQIYDPTAYYNLVDDAPTATSDQGRALDRVLQSLGRN